MDKSDLYINQYWQDFKIYDKSVEQNKEKGTYLMMDGPPFCTGKPHYGHICTSIIKDVICRFQTMQGYSVPRCLSWDTHGLPIEFEIEKRLGLKSKEDVLNYGLTNYNQECRNIVTECRDEWHKVIRNIGRWVDYETEHKTMDLSYMNTVWKVFKRIYDLGYVYKAYKIMPYSIGCGTPLSNFEAKSNYREVSDPSLTLKIKINNKDVYLLVWTTTPWTLPSNLALCVNSNITYVLIKYKNVKYILSEAAIPRYFKDNQYDIIDHIKGSDMSDFSYTPIFNYYNKEQYPKAFHIYTDDYVSTDTGTGIVHMAPGFGQDDYRVCKKYGIFNIDTNSTNPCPCPVNDNGLFTTPIFDYKGKYIKDCDIPIIKRLKSEDKVFKSLKEKHNYPYCWRSNKPLIQKAVSSWFINVTNEEIKENILKNNDKINWIPEHIGSGRFKNWLEGTVDWCFSRNRFWGNPIPIWTNGTETICISSSRELEKLANLKSGSITDLHRDNIDHIEIPSSFEGGKSLKRIPEVFDCWFESGAMTYVVNENIVHSKQKSIKPVDFIAEGLDQTRGWFYTLTIISSLLDNQPAFKNVIVNGLVLAEDGSKMSKSKKNYPNPQKLLDKYGADALRLYILKSGLVKAEDLKFNETHIKQIYNQVNIMLGNIVKYLEQMTDLHQNQRYLKNKFEPIPLKEILESCQNVVDYWILGCLQKLHHKIISELNQYTLHNLVNDIIDFIMKLSRWYLNLNKSRIQNEIRSFNTSSISQNNSVCLSILCHCLYHLTILIAPFAPFISEKMYLSLKDYYQNKSESVHLLGIQKYIINPESKDIYHKYESYMEPMNCFIRVVNCARYIRTDKLKRMLKKPVNQMIIIYNNQIMVEQMLNNINSLFERELNVNHIIYEIDELKYFERVPELNKSVIGKRYGSKSKQIFNFFNQNFNDIKFKCNNDLEIKCPIKGQDDIYLKQGEELKIKLILKDIYKNYEYHTDTDIVVLMDSEVNQEMEHQYIGKKIVRTIQEYRKNIGLIPTDQIVVYYEFNDSSSNIYQYVINNQDIYIKPLLNLELLNIEENYNTSKLSCLELDDLDLKIYVKRIN